MKKLLKTFFNLNLLCAPITATIGCGTKDIDPPHTLKTVTPANPMHWLAPKALQQSDFYVLANIYATPLATDEYGREYGDLFELTNKNYSNNDPYIGAHDSDLKIWTYKLRNNATWSDYNGNKVANVTVNDFLNTAKFVLNPENTADAYFLWDFFIVGARDLYNEAIENKTNFEDLFNKFVSEGKLGIKVNESEQTVTFELLKPAPYFETVLTYSVFVPTKEETLIDISMDNDFKKGYYTGAFLPKNYIMDNSIVYDKNPNYHFAEQTKINRIKQYLVNDGSISKKRELFEAGTLNDYIIDVNDKAGFETLVGDVNEPKKTPGLVEYDKDHPEYADTRLLLFNYLNSDYFTQKDKTESILKSKLLQVTEVRKFMFENLDKSIYGKYYSELFDDSKVSKNVRNSYVPDSFKFTENSVTKNYHDYEAEYLNTNNLANNITGNDLSDGNDYHWSKAHNDNINIASEETNNVNNLRNLLSTVDKDLSEKLKDNGKIHLNVFLDPTSKLTFNKNVSEMFAKFNVINNNPIALDVETPNTFLDFQEKINSGKHDITISGWFPDYADPMSYLATLKLDGPHRSKFRLGQLFQFDDSNTPLDYNNSSDEEWKKLDNNHKEMFEKLLVGYNSKIEVNKYGENLFKNRFNSSKELESIDAKKEWKDRIKGFAENEANTIFKDYFAMPLIRKSPEKTFWISKLLPFKNPWVSYGLSPLQYANSEVTDEFLTYDEIEALRTSHIKEKEEVKSDITKHRKGLAWSI
ncbi:ABC transporter substrate-binding protein [Spiroplasma turonicum]|uniref:Oligopeptide-binding protein SarA n=1 Tax=Spiroplasma turonicum TaxID=216946 RepID=A0A0K1P7Y6_9MOLU|nr:ABC transporter substrate-binding protein [Spiroplasma turonicum]AKU79982.1 oligopeptide-binding protein SarA [Spiroplasma turonicum]ALX70984.1 peptide/nickel ABC transporter substrate-binding protein [Spiroplasma turonicum]